jgi:NADPH:quinone reductase-like Zn-dependent oxidoreductase
MKALGFKRQLEIGELKNELTTLELPTPEPDPKQLLVKIHATCINIDDIHSAEGTFLGGFLPFKATEDNPCICGVDVAGTVEKVGDQVIGFKPGDEVMGYSMPSGHGTWAEYCCVSEKLTLKKPSDYTFEEAAACAIGGKTAANGVMSAAVTQGQTCLVIGASGGIGTLIVQILKAQGAVVTGVCSSRNIELVKSIGAEKVIDYTKGPFEEQLKEIKFDRVIDCIGGRDTEAQAIKILKKNGKFVTLCGPDKYIGETRNGKWGMIKMFSYISLRAFLSMIIGPRYIMAGIGSSPAPIQNLILKNSIKPVIDRKLSLDDNSVKDGIAYVASHRSRGKVVISVIE